MPADEEKTGPVEGASSMRYHLLWVGERDEVVHRIAGPGDVHRMPREDGDRGRVSHPAPLPNWCTSTHWGASVSKSIVQKAAAGGDGAAP